MIVNICTFGVGVKHKAVFLSVTQSFTKTLRNGYFHNHQLTEAELV